MSKNATAEEQILAAARKIFLEKGLEGARMQDIADAAGFNKALVHYYFRSKEKLFETIFQQVAAEFLPKIFGILQAPVPLFEKIQMFCEAYITQEIKTPYVPMFIMNEINKGPEAFLKKVLQSKNPPVDVVLKQIKEEAKKGIIKPVEPVQLLMNILGLCVFPFLARPMLQSITGLSMKQFEDMMEKRKQEVAKMIIDSLKP